MESGIAQRCRQKDIVPRCDSVMGQGGEFFHDLYDAASAHIAKDEVSGVDAKVRAEAKVQLQGECRQGTEDLLELYGDAALARAGCAS